MARLCFATSVAALCMSPNNLGWRNVLRCTSNEQFGSFDYGEVEINNRKLYLLLCFLSHIQKQSVSLTNGYNQYNENNDMTQFYYDHKNIYMKGKQFGVNYLPFLL